ncbi:hypothetical protein [Sideroxydans sp.]
MNQERRLINEDELQVFFMGIGAGIWHLQHVENALNTFITLKVEIKEPGSVAPEAGEAILAKHRRNTLGTSIRIAKEKEVLSAELLVALEKFKDERDWLVHRSMNQNADDLYINTRRNELIDRLHKFVNEATQLQKLIAKELEDFVVGKGVSREWIQKKAISDIREKQGK